MKINRFLIDKKYQNEKEYKHSILRASANVDYENMKKCKRILKVFNDKYSESLGREIVFADIENAIQWKCG